MVRAAAVGAAEAAVRGAASAVGGRQAAVERAAAVVRQAVAVQAAPAAAAGRGGSGLIFGFWWRGGRRGFDRTKGHCGHDRRRHAVRFAAPWTTDVSGYPHIAMSDTIINGLIAAGGGGGVQVQKLMRAS